MPMKTDTAVHNMIAFSPSSSSLSSNHRQLSCAHIASSTNATATYSINITIGIRIMSLGVLSPDLRSHRALDCPRPWIIRLLDSWIHGFPDLCTEHILYFSIPGCKDSRNLGFPDSQIPGFSDPRFPDSWIPGFPHSRIPGFPDSRIPGFPDFWIPRFPDSRIP